MRINVYTEELLPLTQGKPFPVCEIITKTYINSRTKKATRNYGLRIYLHSSPQLHTVEGRDDDRSAVTFWCGTDVQNVFDFLDSIRTMAKHSIHESRTWG